ncbi:MAG TPA: carboxypeptidase-like regulatory domain-containing protein [Flavobacteriales bacterium]|nr:carboxypeptidase-like regulatory domain-containing protein [Flavobacteriales bacterium]
MRYITGLFIMALLASSSEALAFKLRIDGLVTDYATQRPMAKARVRVYKDGILDKMQGSDAQGRYTMVFDNNASYVVRVDAPGYQGKCITIDTHGKEWEGDGRISSLEVEMRLPAVRPGVDLSFLDLPMGVARFDPSTGLARWNRTYERNVKGDVRETMVEYDRYSGDLLQPTANRRPRAEATPVIRL